MAPALIHDDVPLWVVLGHAESQQLVRSPAQFTKDSRIWSALRDGLVKPDHPLMPHIAWQPMCAHTEGEQHRRWRGAIDTAVSATDFRSLRRYVNRSVQRVVNRFCESGEADLVSQYAEHLPMAVMCHVLGMPDEYDDRMVQAARDMIRGTETAIASNAYVMEALNRLTARRRKEPRNDFTGHLVSHPAGLSDEEVSQHLRVVLIAAYEATANLLANVLRQVLIDPRFRSQLNGGQMTVPQAVEQLLWDEPPFSTIFAYYAKQDTELGGQRIRKGDGLLFAPAPPTSTPGPPRPDRRHAGQPLAPRVRRRHPRVPRPGHRPCHRRGRRRRPAHAAAGRGAELRRGGADVHRVDRLTPSGLAAGALHATAAAGDHAGAEPRERRGGTCGVRLADRGVPRQATAPAPAAVSAGVSAGAGTRAGVRASAGFRTPVRHRHRPRCPCRLRPRGRSRRRAPGSGSCGGGAATDPPPTPRTRPMPPAPGRW